MIIKILLTFIALILFFTPSHLILADSESVIINEIAWMGTKESSYNEWIELYNNSSIALDLNGWTLSTKDGGIKIDLVKEIPSKGFLLLERTDDKTVSKVEADFVYQGALSNNGEILRLTNSKKELIDEVDCSSGWLAGDNKEKTTMERKIPLTPRKWQTSRMVGGTPRGKNGKEESLTTKEHFSYPKNIFINELLPSPKGLDSENEWIEIFNKNIFDVDLSNWQLADVLGKTTIFTFPEKTFIEGRGFLVLHRPSTKITLNNGGDGLEISNPEGEVIDVVIYDKAPRNESFNRVASDWKWSTVLTPGKINNIQNVPPEINDNKEENNEEVSIENSSINTAESEKKIATINKQFTRQKFPFILLTGLIIAFFSVVVILLLEKRLNRSS